MYVTSEIFAYINHRVIYRNSSMKYKIPSINYIRLKFKSLVDLVLSIFSRINYCFKVVFRSEMCLLLFLHTRSVATTSVPFNLE